MNAPQGQSIRRNVSVIAASRIITTSSSIVLMLIVPRVLGDVEYGRYYLAQSLLMLFMVFVEFGVGGSLPKAVARHPNEAGQVVADALGVRMALACIAYVGLVVFALVAGYPAATVWVIVVIGLAVFVNAVAVVFNGLYQGLEVMQVSSLAGVVGTLVIVGGGIAAVLLGGGSVGFSAAVLVGTSIIPVMLVAKMGPYLSALPRPRLGHAFEMLRSDLPYFLNTLFGMVYYRIDTVMLSLMASEAVVGWYGAAYRFFDSLMFVPYLLTSALFPVLSRLWQSDPDRYRQTLQRTIVLVLLVGIPLAIVTFMEADAIVDLFFGLGVYGPTVVLLQILSIGMILVYVDSIVGSALMSADRQRSLSLISLSAVFLNIGMNAVGIPWTMERWGNGAIGAAVATGLTELYVMTMMFRLLPTGSMTGAVVMRIGKAVGVGLLTAAALAWLHATGVHWMVATAIAMAAYLVLVIVARILRSEDFDLIAAVPVIGDRMVRMVPLRFRTVDGVGR